MHISEEVSKEALGFTFLYIFFIIPMLFRICFSMIRIIFTVLYFLTKFLIKIRLIGVFIWFLGFCVIYWNDESMAKYKSIAPFYIALGVIIGIITVLCIITAIIRIWKPEFSFITLLKNQISIKMPKTNC